MTDHLDPIRLTIYGCGCVYACDDPFLEDEEDRIYRVAGPCPDVHTPYAYPTRCRCGALLATELDQAVGLCFGCHDAENEAAQEAYAAEDHSALYEDCDL
jgi:hypothetical protein